MSRFRRHRAMLWSALAIILWTLGLCSGRAVMGAGPAAAHGVDFARQIKPILSNNCFKCHGPDAGQRKAGLRLDTREGATSAAESGEAAIAPGKSADSELVRRISASDADDVMPPPATHKTLTAPEKELLARWIDEGATYRVHWAFVAPARPALPEVRDTVWPKTEIDRFVLARLEEAAIAPAPEANRATLLRRLSLDLTGLPPTPAEVERLVSDDSPDAYEKAVDRLLASPHYGEKMAQQWLDLARFGDTNGYQDDGYRSMWPYRDGVIAAFSANMPFDRFTIEQLAGDLLPSATLEQKIASGFNRNNRFNEEGGADPDEFMVAYAIDRVNTTATVWLGLTAGCAQCHDHKYDPISQREYYQLYAFFNSLKGEVGVSKEGSPPLVRVPSRDERREMDALAARIASIEKTTRERAPQIAAAVSRWEQQGAAAEIPKSLSQGLAAHYALDDATDAHVADTSGNARHGRLVGGALKWVAAARGRAPEFDGARSVIDLGQTATFERTQPFSFACWFNFDQPLGAMLTKMDDGDAARGYEVGILPSGRLFVRLVHSWPDDALRVVTQNKFNAGSWHYLTVTYDGSSSAGGVTIYVDGEAQKADVDMDRLTQSIRSQATLALGRRTGQAAFRGALRDLRVYERRLTSGEAASLHTALFIENVLATPPSERSVSQQQKLADYWVGRFDPEQARLTAELVKLGSRLDAVTRALPTSLVMDEMDVPRPAYVLARGDFQQPLDEVRRDVPAVFPPFAAAAPRNRLGLARWLVDPSNPLTARVAVNRLWKQFFGAGLVRTVDDFGTQGQLPTHPELLDWLAREYVASGWNTKALQKKIVMSATYRQASAMRPELSAVDPENRLLARGARFRLSAEEIRDAVLATSGLLSRAIGGPSVFPEQPANYFSDKSPDWQWNESKGADRDRRGLYTFWRRTTPYPSMQTFDAPSRELCAADRPRTNTPLQALVTLNDPSFFRAAQALARRVIREGGAAQDTRIDYAMRLAVARAPSAAERNVLARHYRKQHARYEREPQEALRMARSAGAQGSIPADVVDLAAWTAVANVVLNLDETITRE